MLIQIDKQSGVPVYRQVMDQVTRQIMTGHLEVGQRLDSVAVLSNQLKVNPMTISKAYGYLVQEGLLERRAGIGLFVNTIHPHTRHELQTEMLAEVMNKAVNLVVQMNVSDDEAKKLFTEYLKQANARRNKMTGKDQ